MFGFASLRLLIGPKDSHLTLNQSSSELKPIPARSLALPALQAICLFLFLVLFDIFGFGPMTLFGKAPFLLAMA